MLNNSLVLRKLLKTTLLYLETDIKADNTYQKQHLLSLIERDHTLVEEDEILAYDRERIKQLEDEKLKERIQAQMQ